MFNVKKVSTIIIGAGPAGLSFSQQLSRLSIDHVIFERGEIANSWKTERWDSLKLLTPNYKFNLPDFRYVGRDPNGFMEKDEVVERLMRFAKLCDAPVHNRTSVRQVTKVTGGYRVVTNRATWFCRTLVLANGAFGNPVTPSVASSLPKNTLSLHSKQYKNPAQMQPGKVLVVGASASGLQIANELVDSGFDVTLSVGEHVKIPRNYRGKDIFWWLDISKLATEYTGDVLDRLRLQNLPSPQLTGSNLMPIFDLTHLSKKGVKLVGKLSGVSNGNYQFSGALKNTCKLADLKLNRLLDKFDSLPEIESYSDTLTQSERFSSTVLSETENLSVACTEVQNVIWATGLKPDYSWLKVPVLNHKGMLNQTNGIVSSPGMFTLGLPSMRTRQSSYIHGIAADAIRVSSDLKQYLDKPSVSQSTLGQKLLAKIS